MKVKNNRIIYLDYLKLLGLLCIIVAHVCNNPYIMQIRSFDVPLMVIISGILANESYKKYKEKNKSILKYYWKRFVRLVIPTWLFLTVYFCISCLFNYFYTPKKILESYFLLDGIGYVWIIRIYLICTLLTPLIYWLNEKKTLKWLYTIYIYIVYEILVSLNFMTDNFIFKYFIYYAIPYGIIYSLGMNSNKINSKQKRKVALVFLIIFFISFIAIFLYNGEIKLTSFMKYPPRIYYISYALFVSFLLLSIFENLKLKELNIINFCSKSSLWIYLWHILFLKFTEKILINVNWIIEFMIVLFGAVFITYIQNKLVDILEKTNFNKNILKIFRG